FGLAVSFRRSVRELHRLICQGSLTAVKAMILATCFNLPMAGLDQHVAVAMRRKHSAAPSPFCKFSFLSARARGTRIAAVA
ncbi:MAG: hypothetical protein AAFR68_14600, partial [Pseudomonadota bacterium]